MSDLDFTLESSLLSYSEAELTVKKSEWLANTPFGQGFQRSIYLLRRHFFWLVLLYFTAGVLLAFIVLPINSIRIVLEALILSELLAPVLNLRFLLNLLSIFLLWELLRNFILFFGVFILNTLAIYHVLTTETTARVLTDQKEASTFPVLETLGVGVVTSAIVAITSLIPFITPVIQVLLFFIPAILIIEKSSFRKTIQLSVGMRSQHWQRIMSALILSYVFMVFAEQFGYTLFLNLEAVFLLWGIPLGVAGAIPHILLTQILVAMVAPLLPLFSVAFYAGAKGALREDHYRRFMRRVERQRRLRNRLIPLSKQPHIKTINCPYCDTTLKFDAKFCSQCGSRIGST